MSNFHTSPTFDSTVNSCSMKGKFKYIDKLKLKKENVSLLRGRIVHRAVQLWITRAGTTGDIPNKVLINRLLCEAAGRKDDDPFAALHEKYDFPPQANKIAYFSWDEFKSQLLAHLEIIQEFYTLENLAPVALDSGLACEVGVRYPLVYKGEVLLEHLGVPVLSHNIIDLLARDRDDNVGIYDWKIGMKKYTRKHGLTGAHLNDAMISYAIGANECYGIPFPVPTYHVHTVVNKKGERSKTLGNFEYKGIKGLEVVRRDVQADEVEGYLRSAAMTADDFLNERFRCTKSEMCITMCDFNRICLKGDDTNYESWEKDDAK